MEKDIQLIDIDKIIARSNSKILKKLPSFLISYLKRIAHQNEINDFLIKHSSNYGIDFINAAIEDTNVSYTIQGLENIPKNGRYIFVANHPLGGFDGMVLYKTVFENFGDAKFISNNILLNIKNLSEIFAGVNTTGSSSRQEIVNLENIFSSNMQVLIFPAGLVSRKHKGVIKDLEWKKTFVTKAIQHEREVVPIYISGNLSNFFYRLSNIRKFFKIKSNIEMLYLADETFRFRDHSFTLTFGKPISYKIFSKEYSHQNWAMKIREHIYKIPQGHNEFIVTT